MSGNLESFVKVSCNTQQHMVVVNLGNSTSVSFGCVSFRSVAQWEVCKGMWDCSEDVQMADTSSVHISASSH